MMQVELQKASMYSNIQAALTRLQGGDPTTPSGAHHPHHPPGGASPDARGAPNGQPKGVSPAASAANLRDADPNQGAGDAQGDGIPLPPAAQQPPPQPPQHQGPGFLGLGALKRAAAATAQHLTTMWVDNLSRTPVQVVVDLVSFEGTLLLWLSPPPSDR